MSRYAETSQILISDDISNQPQNIRFNESISDIDIATLTKLEVLSPITIPTGTPASLPTPAGGGKFLFIKPSADTTVTIDGSSHVFKGGKASKLWITYSTLTVAAVGTPPQAVTATVVMGG